MNKQDTELVQLSLVEHIRAALLTSGWTTPAKWVNPVYIEPETSPPAVGVRVLSVRRTTYESGNIKRQGNYRIVIDVKGANAVQLSDLDDCITNNLSGIAIINFNTAMQGDGGYDAAAQTIAYGECSENIEANIIDLVEFQSRITFILRPDRPL